MVQSINCLREADKMRYKTNRIIAFLMIMILAFNFAGCTGTGKLSGDPSDIISELERSITSAKAEDILSLTTVEKGSSLYREYKDIIDIDLYDDEIAGCYKAVASKIKLKFSDADVETVSGMAKVNVTFSMPDWKKVFADRSITSADALIEAVNKAENVETHLTLRLIDTKEGLKIKNVEDLVDIFEFVGGDIVSSPSWGEPAETKPETSETKPAENDPSETEPSETQPGETEPSKEPTKAPQPGSNDAMTAAYADYKKILAANKDGIDAFEKRVSSDSCGLADINGDGISDLYFFTVNESDKYVKFNVYSYNPSQKAASAYLSASLIEIDSKVSEFAVIKCPNGDIVAYKGFIDDKNAISYYSLYQDFEAGSASLLAVSGFMICGVTGGDTGNAVCSVRGFDKYTSNTKIKYDEFVKIEKDLMDKADVLFGSKFLSGVNSNVSGLLSGRKNDGQPYEAVIKQLG